MAKVKQNKLVKALFGKAAAKGLQEAQSMKSLPSGANTNLERDVHLLNIIKEQDAALTIAANQLEGVSLAIAEHGTNINADFFIYTYKSMAGDIRKTQKILRKKAGSK